MHPPYPPLYPPLHRARETIELLTMETTEFIPPSLWPPNRTDLNPVDYKVWSVTGLELSGGWEGKLNPPVHVYRRSFLSENRL